MAIPVGFIGVGNMAGAILEGGLRSETLERDQVFFVEASDDRAKAVEEQYGVTRVKFSREMIKNVDIVILGVKPNQVADALEGLALSGKALISIVTGWEAAAIYDLVPGARILRVMPNTPLLVGAGMSAFALKHTLLPDERRFAERLFGASGLVEWVEEYLMEAVTGVSGSGPAYGFIFIEALADAGVRAGLSRDTALRMAAQTLYGASKMVIETGKHPGALKDMVASPGGTTIEAIRSLESNSFRSAVMEASLAAYQRAVRMKNEKG